MTGKLILKDGTIFEGKSFGAPISTAGEVVFATGMTGYPETLTDPSYKGQILITTYPILGNYGIPDKKFWESDRIQVSGLIVSDYIDTPSHFQSKMTLAQWFKKEKLPLIEIKDTRFLTQKIREKGVMLGKIIIDKDVPDYDPNLDNLVAQVSTKTVIVIEPNLFFERPQGVEKQLFSTSSNKKNIKTVILIDCGAKNNIERCFLKRGVRVIHAPWDFDPFSREGQNQLKNVIARSETTKQSRGGSPRFARDDELFDALFISNGPGDPKMADKTITTVKKSLENKIPTLGICLGNQILALAAGGDTYKLKYGHRSQNQPCIDMKTNRCYITTHNHGFAIGRIPDGFKPWFINANDNTNEGIFHERLPFLAVQFHPEATPGPKDTEWIFDFFLEKIK